MSDDPTPEGNKTDTGKEPERIVPQEELDKLKELYPELPEEKLEGLSRKLKGYDSHLYKKSEELSRQTKVLTEREAEIKDVADKLKAAAVTPQGSQARSEAEESFDTLIENTADPTAREGLRRLFGAFQKEAEKIAEKKLGGRIEKLEKDLDGYKTSTQSDRVDQLNKEVKTLREKYGDEIVDKHYDEIIKGGVQYRHSARRLLHYFADPDELEQALRIQVKKSTNGEQGAKPTKPVSSIAKPDSERYKIDKSKPGDAKRKTNLAIRDVMQGLGFKS